MVSMIHLGLNFLIDCEHKFKHDFADIMNPLCLCSLKIENTVPYRGKKTGHKINRVKLLVEGNFSHLHIKLVTFPRLNFGF